MPQISIPLTDEQLAALEAEIATTADPKPTVAAYLQQVVALQILEPMVRRQEAYSEGRAIERVKDLLPKLRLLTTEQQDAIKAQASAAIDALLEG